MAWVPISAALKLYDRTCNVVIIAASTQNSGHFRANALLFKDNSLKLPTGIQYLNDWDKVGYGHHAANPY